MERGKGEGTAVRCRGITAAAGHRQFEGSAADVHWLKCGLCTCAPPLPLPAAASALTAAAAMAA